jgi:uncharacterized membrane protein YdfJ with MMPL/SSD domain
VLLGYLAALGLTDLWSQALHRGPGPWDGLDWTVGFFLFVILVAVGEDYNILLMTRVDVRWGSASSWTHSSSGRSSFRPLSF